MYTDEGISGVMTKNRDGFNRMVADALSGKDRPHRHKKCEPLRPEYRGQPHHRPQAEGAGRGGLLPEGEYLHPGQQRGAAHHHHVQPGPGGKPLHLGKRHLGTAEAVRGRKGQDIPI